MRRTAIILTLAGILHKKDKVLLGIPVNKFEDLEKRIRAGYVQKVMPPLDISHFATAFAFKFSELLP